jgi:hypothetical protein
MRNKPEIIRIIILIVIAIASFYTGKLDERVKWEQFIADITWNCINGSRPPVQPNADMKAEEQTFMVPEVTLDTLTPGGGCGLVRIDKNGKIYIQGMPCPKGIN